MEPSSPSQLEPELTCSLCLNTYKKPKILACYHSFCCECLEKHALTSQRNGTFSCPECETEVLIPDGNQFDDLPTSIHLNRLLNYLAIRQREKGFEDAYELRCAKCNLNRRPEIHYIVSQFTSLWVLATKWWKFWYCGRHQLRISSGRSFQGISL